MITIFGSPNNILARPIQIHSSILGPDHCKPSRFGLVEVNTENKPLSWLTPKKTPTGKIILINCQQEDAPKFENFKEAEDYLKTFEVA